MDKQSQKKKKKLENEYQQIADKYRPKPKVFMNCLKAFLVGGFICLIGQGLSKFYAYLGMDPATASNTTVATLVFLSCLLTGLGVYDTIGQWAGAGTAVPVTGFANSMASAALEHKSEGWVLGVGGNMFKLAGAVITFGVVSAFLVSLIQLIVKMFI
ncbi:stage V sporulation protein AC [Baia soyae]|uniref:Stage V sporulation protein AC n=1 Tax=Baia soyae TaxID=1544746 RepID=A0A4R2RPE2_9BACL|nr:stage V sporulation protein AC [Baia soyae]TCP64918.1 stage V sporulation protein AC [Baia soyae]